MPKFLDSKHPWFRPLWVRVLVTALPLAWGIFEFVGGSPSWGVIFVALAAYAAWEFFFAPGAGGGQA
jgi:hypothetical protein